MSLAALTREGVLAATAEFDRLGRRAFLRSTGFGPARAYFLDLGGRLYDSKAIVGYAHGVSAGTPLSPRDFSGGDETVARRLEALGFSVAFLPNPDWSRDEIILACDLVVANGWRQLAADDQRVHELSFLLQSTAIHPGRRNPDFRNLSGVALKTYNIVAPSSNGNRLDREVYDDFKADPIGMHAMADRIRELLLDPSIANPTHADPDVDDYEANEGGLALRAHFRRERDPKLRRKKIAEAEQRGLRIVCEACGFDFAKVYGARGAGYIECHHRVALSVSGQTTTRLADLALICSNCHRMIHRSRPWLSVEDLKSLISGGDHAGTGKASL
ncbi:HNH endonuclease [Asanoa iriomotensis]|uniref:5-methylcytosine-specific restriction protein A n=1 Tax=Asanoa iriomotensis TaxID=234613 RepID=A0ABQ4CGW0_9ACTN|nr:HNH endonuclease [Asanoa iriomotensis]GIF61721.1 hypothetical protein Air01nite_78160 [Asanoa iriomotensis]